MREVLWQLIAVADRSGNPRRALVHCVWDADGIVQWGVYDEGFAGRDALPEDVRGLWWDRISMNVSVRTYRDALRGVYVPGAPLGKLQGV